MRLLTALLLTAAVSVPAQAGQSTPPRPQGLKIVVIQGEDAVNVIQQRSATTPIVEVRDRNDQPVAGAVVRFAIRSGKASFNGARAVTLTTNATGQATATGLSATGSGSLQITATAAFQGQTAAVTISQTNVIALGATGSSAGTAGSGAGAGGSAGGSTAGAGAGAGAAAGAGSAVAAGAGGAGAGVGGLSVTTLAVVGGAVAGGTIAAKSVLDPANPSTTYSGSFSGTMITTSSLAVPCTITTTHSGTIAMDVEVASDGTVSGSGGFDATGNTTSATCSFAQFGAFNHGCCTSDPPVTGTASALSMNGSHPGNGGSVWTYAFAGAKNGGEIAGTFTLTAQSAVNFGQMIVPVTLR